jgi:hypothetical protein
LLQRFDAEATDDGEDEKGNQTTKRSLP